MFCSVASGFSLWIPAARAQTGDAINGVYSGTYFCDGGIYTRFKVSLTAAPPRGLAGAFTVYPANSSVPEGYTYDLAGPYNPAYGNFQLAPQKWETAAAPNFKMMGMSGRFNAAVGQIVGTMLGGCGNFRAARDQTIVSKAPAAPAPAPQNTPPAQPSAATGRQRPQAPPDPNTSTAPMEIQIFD